jgi:hypothetical protein
VKRLTRRTLVLAFVIAFLASAVPLGTRVFAATLVVDDDHIQCPTAAFASINAAIAFASPGDTIQVCPGTYNEQVNINKNDLKLRGAQAGINATSRGFNPLVEAIVQDPCGPVQIEADRDVLDGFTVQGSTEDPTIFPACFGAGIWTNPGFSGSQGGHQIVNNIVQNNISGIELDSTCVNASLVEFNLIRNNSNPGAGSGNGIQTNFGLCNATIDRNTFSGDISSSYLVVAPSSGLAVTNNALVAGTPESIAWLFVSNSTISGNVSTGSTSSGTVDLFGGNSGIAVTSNTLLNGNRAIVVDNPFSNFGVPPNSNIAAHLNCIKGNVTAGMAVDPLAYPITPQLNAENNWWGDASGPNELPRNPTGTGDRIIDLNQNVDFVPWLTVPPGPPCPAAPPPPNTPGKVTGGGYIQPSSGTSGGGIVPLDTVVQLAEVLIGTSSNPSSVGGKATFGFVVTCCAPQGNLEYNDHGANLRVKATSFTNLVITDVSPACPAGKHAQFKGQADETTTTATQSVMFTVDVDDCGEPGSSPGAGPDTFKIQTSSGYMAGGLLVGGNIQIHRS